MTELAILAQAASTCTECRLAERRRNVVFGEGDPTAGLVLVGEGPGDTEDALGRPFVGRAGQLLDRAIGDAGLRRDQVYITNTVKCRAADWSTGKPVNRAPLDDEAPRLPTLAAAPTRTAQALRFCASARRARRTSSSATSKSPASVASTSPAPTPKPPSPLSTRRTYCDK